MSHKMVLCARHCNLTSSLTIKGVYIKAEVNISRFDTICINDLVTIIRVTSPIRHKSTYFDLCYGAYLGDNFDKILTNIRQYTGIPISESEKAIKRSHNEWMEINNSADWVSEEVFWASLEKLTLP